jgi:hypothetical protein
MKTKRFFDNLRWLASSLAVVIIIMAVSFLVVANALKKGKMGKEEARTQINRFILTCPHNLAIIKNKPDRFIVLSCRGD